MEVYALPLRFCENRPDTFAQKSGVGSPVEHPLQSGWFPNVFEGLPIATGWSYSATARRFTVIVSTPTIVPKNVSTP